MNTFFILATIIVTLLFAGISAQSATVTVYYNQNVGTINMEYGMNECDRALYFAGATSYPNAPIIDNHKQIRSQRIRVFYRNDWTQANLDKLIQAIIASNALPLVCFQYVPSGMSWSQWGDWCASIVNRYKGMYDISNWMWEIINEPDLTGWTKENYVSLFTVVEPKIHAAYANAMVGGPATSALKTDWNTAMLNSSSGSNIQFFSWHRYGGWYPGPNWPSDTTIMNQVYQYDLDIDIAYNNLPADKKHIKLIIDEFNVNAWAGDINGLWSTDPRIKTVFNAAYYAALLKRFLRTTNGRQLAAECHWEGTGDDYPGGQPGFGMWYSQVPTNRTPAFYSKVNIVNNFPQGATLVNVTSDNTNIEAFACKYGDPLKYRLCLYNKTSSTISVNVRLLQSNFQSGSWYVVDSASPQGRVESAVGTNMTVVLAGYTVRVLGDNPPQALNITQGPTVTSTMTSATISWTTDVPSSSIVYWGPTSAYTDSFEDYTQVTNHSVTINGLNPDSLYHYMVESSGDGLQTVTSGDKTFWTQPDPNEVILKIGEAKQFADNTPVTLKRKIVTMNNPSESYLYIQETGRSSGIRVSANVPGLTAGDLVTVSGNVATRSLSGYRSERHITGASVLFVTSEASPIPLDMNCQTVGGQTQGLVPGVASGMGTNNMGLLARISGKITSIDGQFIFIDDGSNIANVYGVSTARTGIMARCPDTNIPASVGDIVWATGVIEGSIPVNWTLNRRYIRLRDWGDLFKY